MRIGLVMDASCDLPESYVRAHNITVLPITVRIDDKEFVDQGDAQELKRFVGEHLGDRSHAAETSPYSVEQIQDLFLDRLVVDYDCVFCLTITATRSPIFSHATQASFAILRAYRDARQKAGVPGPFLLRVIDTQTLFAGSAVQVVEAVRLIREQQSPAQIRERLEYLAQRTYGYMLPRDLYYLRARAKKKGDRSVGLFGAALASALDIKPLLRGFRGETGPVAKMRGFEQGANQLLDHVAERVHAGLLVPTVCLSYGGPLREVEQLPAYKRLREICTEHGVELLQAPMSITGMVNVGAGALVVGFASEPYEAQFH